MSVHVKTTVIRLCVTVNCVLCLIQKHVIKRFQDLIFMAFNLSCNPCSACTTFPDSSKCTSWEAEKNLLILA